MKYSFVLPAYKATFLREAIDSILNQTYKDFELIIVNDASPEDLTSIVNSYSDERIQYYVNEKNIGGIDLVAQWNHCIKYAKGGYLILASDDDIYLSDYLEKMDVLIDKYPEVNIFRPRVQHVDTLGIPKGAVDSLDGVMSQGKFAYLLQKKIILSGIPFYIFKHEELIKNGGFVNFPLAWFSDDATAIRLARNGIVMHHEILFHFRQSNLNISCSNTIFTSLLAKLRSTDLFYRWLMEELQSICIPTNEAFYKKELDYLKLEKEKQNHMIWLLSNSNLKSIFFSWLFFRNLKSISFAERNIICIRAIMLRLKVCIKSIISY